MNAPVCERITLGDLIDYAIGELSEAEHAATEEHLFSCADCGARANEFEALASAIGPAIRSGEVGGVLTDHVLNRLEREGVRVRTFTLSPGASVPCAVWDDDELMVTRLRGNFGSEFTLSQRVAGTEVGRTTGQFTVSAPGEIIHVLPAAWVRQLPVVEVELLLTVHEGGEQREVGRYVLHHGGSLRR
jgi:Putative zinc-finger